jgi:hypothetical protein
MSDVTVWKKAPKPKSVEVGQHWGDAEGKWLYVVTDVSSAYGTALLDGRWYFMCDTFLTDDRWHYWEEFEAQKPAPHTSSGAACTRCREYNEYAVANQPDGGFLCYSCRR